MHLIPERVSLASKAVDVLRDQLRSGEWGNFLPTERELSERMRIGRNTLRAALQRLHDEGWIEKGHVGRRRRILKPSATGETEPVVRRRSVVLLSPYDPQRLTPFMMRETDILRRSFNAADCRFEIRSSLAFRSNSNCGRLLDTLVTTESASLWILQGAPPAIQEWFQKRGLPTVIVGYASPGITLPFLTEDIVAAAGHALRRMETFGHRRIAFLHSRPALAGHEIVFEESARLCETLKMTLARCTYKNQEEMCQKLGELFSKPDRPTAILAMHTKDVITTMTFLAQMKISPPQDYSMVSLFDDPSLDAIFPALTRYQTNPEHFLNQLHTLSMHVIRKESFAHLPVRLMPDFVKGETLAPLGTHPPKPWTNVP